MGRVQYLYTIELSYLWFVPQSKNQKEVERPRAQNLRQGIVMKTSLGTQVSRMGLGSFVDIDNFVMYFYVTYSFFIISFFLIS